MVSFPRARPRLLDLYCCDGAASMGYMLAGFEVEGVDIADRRDYPFRYYQADAITFLLENSDRYHAFAASPPCQQHTPLKAYANTKAKRAAYDEKFVDLLATTRATLDFTGKPYVIENVPGAPLIDPITLCGPMFDLPMYRHRLFESNVDIASPPHQPHGPRCARNGYLPTEDRPYMSIHGGKHSRAWQRAAAEAMGAPWITTIVGICEAIPPAYAKHVGTQLMESL